MNSNLNLNDSHLHFISVFLDFLILLLYNQLVVLTENTMKLLTTEFNSELVDNSLTVFYTLAISTSLLFAIWANFIR